MKNLAGLVVFLIFSSLICFLLKIVFFVIDLIGFFNILGAVLIIVAVILIIVAVFLLVNLVVVVAKDLQSNDGKPPAAAQSFLERNTPPDWRETLVSEFWDLYERQYQNAQTKFGVVAANLNYYRRTINTRRHFITMGVRNRCAIWASDWVFSPVSVGPTIQTESLTVQQNPTRNHASWRRGEATVGAKKRLRKCVLVVTSCNLVFVFAFSLSTVPFLGTIGKLLGVIGVLLVFVGALYALFMTVQVGFLTLLGTFGLIDLTARLLHPKFNPLNHSNSAFENQPALKQSVRGAFVRNLFFWVFLFVGGISAVHLIYYASLVLIERLPISMLVVIPVLLVSWTVSGVSVVVIAVKVLVLTLLGMLRVMEGIGRGFGAFNNFLPRVQRGLIHILGVRSLTQKEY